MSQSNQLRIIEYSKNHSSGGNLRNIKDDGIKRVYLKV